ncbi:hypothetical protein BC628DRAFT_1379699 [Trametes gibbosa]|nr:hypothetical protein BC628DRAFT_1406312 [Trametes gibbosa]KAI0824454.1 hypothetical protein BC628DRAFT_1379699 [Trametes gibbosa]
MLNVMATNSRTRWSKSSAQCSKYVNIGTSSDNAASDVHRQHCCKSHPCHGPADHKHRFPSCSVGLRIRRI